MTGSGERDTLGAQRFSRRTVLKMSATAAAGGAVLSALPGAAFAAGKSNPPSEPPGPTQQNSLFQSLRPYRPGSETLGPDEMRISFMGTSPIPRIAQACNSVFVELGNGDCFVFDAGSGVMAKYNAMGIRYGQMDKVFLAHLHADHTSDLTHIYGFGVSSDRKSPLYIFGPSSSGVPDPENGELYDDGTRAFCATLRELNRWHSEAFSFLPTRYKDFVAPPFDPDGHTEGYDIVPFELDWRTVGGVAYEHNDVRITHFPAVHDRQGSISYKLEWNGLSMIYTSDTRPTRYTIDQASGGVDVLIHEMVVPPEVWAAKNTGLQPGDEGWERALFAATQIERNSHTTAEALGYLLSQIDVPPRLAVATHFQATNDTIRPALEAVRRFYPDGPFTIALDLMVLNVTKRKIDQRRAVVSDFAWQAPAQLRDDLELAPPKYRTKDGRGDPYAQLDPDGLAHVIPEEEYATP
jgi:ribonuclease Z